jgi:hypothetical protein
MYLTVPLKFLACARSAPVSFPLRAPTVGSTHGVIVV